MRYALPLTPNVSTPHIIKNGLFWKLRQFVPILYFRTYSQYCPLVSAVFYLCGNLDLIHSIHKTNARVCVNNPLIIFLRLYIFLNRLQLLVFFFWNRLILDFSNWLAFLLFFGNNIFFLVTFYLFIIFRCVGRCFTALCRYRSFDTLFLNDFDIWSLALLVLLRFGFDFSTWFAICPLVPHNV